MDVDSRRYTNFKAYGVVPQIFLGEEIDSWPQMSAAEQRSGSLGWGDRQTLQWWRGDGCAEQQRVSCNTSRCREPAQIKKACRALRSKKVGGRWHLRDSQGGYFTKSLGSRQHLVYMPYSTKGSRGWVSGRTGPYGGGTKTLAENLAEIEQKGRAFLAHPTEGGSPANGAGPNMIAYSKTSLDIAWKSRAVLGLQLWNENDRYRAGPKNAFGTEAVMRKGARGALEYQPSLWRGSKWNWNYAAARSKTTCDDCDLRFHLYHGVYTWDRYLRKGLDPAQTRSISWLKKGQPRKWSIAGGSDAHGDLNFRRRGRPNDCFKVGAVTKIKQWCDTPVTDTAIGTPRNLVHVGRPKGKGSNVAKRHTNRQVIDALEDGVFSVTDGPALRIVIDNNRNGVIDAADHEMGSVVDIFPGEQIPLLVEWWSTPEFGPIKRLDLYFGNKNATFAGSGHGPRGRFGIDTAADGSRRKVSLSDPYKRDPNNVLGVSSVPGNAGMHGHRPRPPRPQAVRGDGDRRRAVLHPRLRPHQGAPGQGGWPHGLHQSGVGPLPQEVWHRHAHEPRRGQQRHPRRVRRQGRQAQRLRPQHRRPRLRPDPYRSQRHRRQTQGKEADPQASRPGPGAE